MEPSPSESLLSAPCEGYSSLFPTDPIGASSPTVDPANMMTPQSINASDCSSPRFSAAPEGLPVDMADGDSDKKPSKKRKSWGQVLPEPKTNLPPRKRAKTEDEKEQRRVERVLRNRRAAQTSRERKRKDYEALEARNKELEDKLALAESRNTALMVTLQDARRDPTTLAHANLDHTLAANLLREQAPETLVSPRGSISAATTVNMTSVSPSPVKEDQASATTSGVNPETVEAPSDETQHSAAMLCNDLQCPSDWAKSPMLRSWATFLGFATTLLSLSVLSVMERPLTQIAMSLQMGSSIRPSPRVLTTIIWLVTHPVSSTPAPTSTSTTGSSTAATSLPTAGQSPTTSSATVSSSTPSTTLRVKLLKKILLRSPNLARGLSTATFAALRLTSRGHDDQVVEGLGMGSSAELSDELTQCLKRTHLPSREALITLLWTIRVHTRKQVRRQRAGPHSRRSGQSVPTSTTVGANATLGVAMDESGLSEGGVLGA